jgi:uncharacterized protein YpiB (UPF0302 family)
MEKNKPNYKLRRDFPLTREKEQPSKKVVEGLYAQLFLENCMAKFKKAQLEKEIDRSLDERDEEAFNKLGKQYKIMYAQNELGLTLTEKNFKFHVNLKW